MVRGLVAIFRGDASGLKKMILRVNDDLRRRQSGFGRGRRMQIEKDSAEIISGLKNNTLSAAPSRF